MKQTSKFTQQEIALLVGACGSFLNSLIGYAIKEGKQVFRDKDAHGIIVDEPLALAILETKKTLLATLSKIYSQADKNNQQQIEGLIKEVDRNFRDLQEVAEKVAKNN